jgi:hypothetical protein
LLGEFIAKVSGSMHLNCLLRTWMCMKLNSAADSARQEDTGGIRYSALAFIPRDPETIALNPPITKQSTWSSRGFNHPATARLLCPIKRLVDFEDNPRYEHCNLMSKAHKSFSHRDFMTKVNGGQTRTIKASAWPSFMYDMDQLEEGCVDKGLCRGCNLRVKGCML